MERLVRKPRSMHLAVTEVVAHIYHIQPVLAQAGADRAWLSPEFHLEIADWRMFAEQTAARPTDLTKSIPHKPTHLGFCDASGLRAGGVWLDPSCLGKYLVWHHLCPADIVTNLVSSQSKEGTITNSDLELSALVLHEATLIAEVPDARLDTTRSGSNNTLTVSWSRKEASTINTVVADLLHICMIHSRKFFINPHASRG